MIINPYVFGGFDADAQAFITAAGITDPTQQSAINTLVINLKAASIWAKMKAIYPFVGGTAITHKWNLKDPQDTNAAFRLVFSGGWTHSSTGALPNGINGYANTFLANNVMNINSIHYAFYSRSNTAAAPMQEIGVLQDASSSPPLAGNSYSDLAIRHSVGGTFIRLNNGGGPTTVANLDSRGFYLGSRTASNVIKLFKNNLNIQSLSTTSNALSNIPAYISAANYGNTSIINYSNRECAFASLGDGLTDTEVLVFNQIVEGYQYELSRNVNPVNANYYNTAYNNETNAFLYASEITDNTQKSAVNTLVNDLQTAGIWTKMKAIYPMVGGTATTHKWNLKDPQDTDAAFRLVFNGGWTHSSTGAKPNGVNGYADTFLKPFNYSQNDFAFGCYLRNVFSQNCFMGALDTYRNYLLVIGSSYYLQINSSNFAATSISGSQTTRLHVISRTTSTTATTYINGSLFFNDNVVSDGKTNRNIYLGQLNNASATQYNSDNEHAFSFISDGLTATDVTNLTNLVNTYQTTLSRQV